VFGFQVGNEKRERAVARIVERLRLACDGARHSGVRLVLENGGSFETARDLTEIIEGVASPLLGASYSMAVAAAAGEDPIEGAAMLGARMWTARVRDRVPGGRPCMIGDGELGVPRFVDAIRGQGFSGWVIVEWDRAWLPDLAPADAVLPEAVRRLHAWAPNPARRGGASAAVVSM
jgi:sugar phosphate isomerase/epimerase